MTNTLLTLNADAGTWTAQDDHYSRPSAYTHRVHCSSVHQASRVAADVTGERLVRVEDASEYTDDFPVGGPYLLRIAARTDNLGAKPSLVASIADRHGAQYGGGSYGNELFSE